MSHGRSTAFPISGVQNLLKRTLHRLTLILLASLPSVIIKWIILSRNELLELFFKHRWRMAQLSSCLPMGLQSLWTPSLLVQFLDSFPWLFCVAWMGNRLENRWNKKQFLTFREEDWINFCFQQFPTRWFERESCERVMAVTDTQKIKSTQKQQRNCLIHTITTTTVQTMKTTSMSTLYGAGVSCFHASLRFCAISTIVSRWWWYGCWREERRYDFAPEVWCLDVKTQTVVKLKTCS